MRFCSEKALRQLMLKGIVATMRNYPYEKDQKIVIKNCDGKIVGRGLVLDVRDVSERHLKELVVHSGFESVEEWIEEARRLHKKMPRFIVLVKMI